MIIAIHQPQYLPWLGYFDKIEKCDKFVLLDDVQFKKNEWQNRNRIKTAQGWQWITLPVLHNFGQKISEVAIKNQDNWSKKHLHALEMNYIKAPHFSRYYDFFKDTFSKRWERLCDLNIFLIESFIKMLNIKISLERSSNLNVSGEKTDRLVSICKALEADSYISGIGAKDYLETDKLEREGIKVTFQKFDHPVYPELYGVFISHLSIADLLFNCGPDSLDIIRSR